MARTSLSPGRSSSTLRKAADRPKCRSSSTLIYDRKDSGVEVGYVPLTPQIYELAQKHFASAKSVQHSAKARRSLTLEELLARSDETLRASHRVGAVPLRLSESEPRSASSRAGGGNVGVPSVKCRSRSPVRHRMTRFRHAAVRLLPLLIGTTLCPSIAMIVRAAWAAERESTSGIRGPRVRRTVKPILECSRASRPSGLRLTALLFVTRLLQRFIPDLAGFNALGRASSWGSSICRSCRTRRGRPRATSRMASPCGAPAGPRIRLR